MSHNQSFVHEYENLHKITNLKDEDVPALLEQLKEKDAPARILLLGTSELSGESIAAFLASILDRTVSSIHCNGRSIIKTAFMNAKYSKGGDYRRDWAIYNALQQNPHNLRTDLGKNLQEENTQSVAEGMGCKTVYWKNQFSLEDMVARAYSVRDQLNQDPGETGIFSFVMPEDKIPAAIMLSSLLAQNLTDFHGHLRVETTPTTLKSAVASKEAKSYAPPVDYVDGSYRITVDKDFSRQVLGDVLGVDASRYKRESANNGNHFIYIPEADLTQALGITPKSQDIAKS